MSSQIQLVSIEDEMKKSYLDYAMSVIVGRALPDVRDGLKPVHRRIIFAMHNMGVEYNKPYKKSARIVGDVIGKYHPHGDTAAYDSLVRMTQDFSLRYPLVDGQGNFGSIDGDSAAAYRYTEARMARISSELLKDIEKETVRFVPNYDDKEFEPTVLPAGVPNLLVNGSSGIAVGMATNMPPHNIGEVIDALNLLISKPEADIKDLLQCIPGPDFPTGATINGRDGIVSAYKTGRGVVKLRAKATIETNDRTKRQAIIVNEIPYMVNKSRLIEKIAFLVRDKKVEGISDLRDESDRDGMRIVIELKKEAEPEIVLNNLYLHTQMQTSFGIINLAIVDGRPKVLTLKEILTHFIQFRKEVVTKRTQFDMRKAKAREHILEGLKIALDNIDAVIKTIRASKEAKEAKLALMGEFKLSEIQSQAILDMKLQRLTGLERDKIEAELKVLAALIKELQSILDSNKKLMTVVVDELAEIKKVYGDERRTEIADQSSDISIEDVIVEEDMVVTVTSNGYIKRNPTSLFKSQKRGGKGKMGMTTREEDFVESIFVASTHSYMLFFTDKGKVYSLKVYDIPQAGRAAKGKAMVNILNVEQGEKITAFLPVREFEENHFIIMGTKSGVIKKSDLMSFAKIRKGGLKAVNLDDKDSLISAHLTNGKHKVLIATRAGMAIKFGEDDVREMGRTARGVKAVKLKKKDDCVVTMNSFEKENLSVLTVTERGYGKRTDLNDYRLQSRGGSGIINIKVTEKNGPVIGVLLVGQNDEVMLTTDKGKIIRIKMKDVSVISRNTQGVRLMNIGKEESVTSVGLVPEAEQEIEE